MDDTPRPILPLSHAGRAAERAYRITGGRRLEGEITVGGAKNAVVKQFVASLLTDEPCVLSGVPRSDEVHTTLDMLTEIGTRYEWLGPDAVRLHTPGIRTVEVGQRYSGFNRIPILLLSPLLHRAGGATVPALGGCRIGPRPVDFHLAALEALGARVESTARGYSAEARGLRGTTVRLPYPSVGATENTLFAAVLARGTTVIENAAVEPEVIDTILLLQKMGAQVAVDVNRRIVVEGVRRLRGAEHAPIPDRIEVASFAAAAVATGGQITVRGARQQHMLTFLNALRKVGGGFTADRAGMTFFRERDRLRPVRLETDVHPGFMTDWQQPFAVLLTQADGASVIHETVYENRFGYADALRAMGAEIDLTTGCLGDKPCRFLGGRHSHSAVIRGATPLRGREIVIPDLRAGFAYLIAGLVAEGETTLRGIPYLERGYANVPEKLAAIGARFETTPLTRAA